MHDALVLCIKPTSSLPVPNSQLELRDKLRVSSPATQKGLTESCYFPPFSVFRGAVKHPLGPLGFNFAQHSSTTRPSGKKDCRERIYAFWSSLGLQCRSSCRGDKGWLCWGVSVEPGARARTHTKPKSAVLRLMVSHGWSKVLVLFRSFRF